MAAAALYRSRGAAGVRAIKGPFFIFTLLCLVGTTTSQIDTEQLGKFMEDLHKAQERINSLNADFMSGKITTSDLVNGYMSIMDQMITLVGRFSKVLPDDFPSMDGLLQSFKDFMDNVKTYTDKVLGEQFEDTNQKLRESWKLRELPDEQQAEL